MKRKSRLSLIWTSPWLLFKTVRKRFWPRLRLRVNWLTNSRQPLKRLKSWQTWKNSTFPIRKNAAPRQLLPVKQVSSPWLVLSCKIVLTSRLKLKSWHLKPFQQPIRHLRVLWIFWLRLFLRITVFVLGPTTKSGITVTLRRPSRINLWMKKKPSRFTMILRIRCLNSKVTVLWPLTVVRN